jgi:hypothetical protein
MAKPTRYAPSICIALSVLLVIGLVLGFWQNNTIYILSFLLPAVIYQVYRTEGKSTKWASWTMLAVIILEFILVIFKINFNLAEFFRTEGEYVAGYYVAFGDLKTIFPVVMAVLSVILFVRTRGKYTKWLAVIIFIGTLAITYQINPEGFRDLIGIIARKAINQY